MGDSRCRRGRRNDQGAADRCGSLVVYAKHVCTAYLESHKVAEVRLGIRGEESPVRAAATKRIIRQLKESDG